MLENGLMYDIDEVSQLLGLPVSKLFMDIDNGLLDVCKSSDKQLVSQVALKNYILTARNSRCYCF